MIQLLQTDPAGLCNFPPVRPGCLQPVDLPHQTNSILPSGNFALKNTLLMSFLIAFLNHLPDSLTHIILSFPDFALFFQLQQFPISRHYSDKIICVFTQMRKSLLVAVHKFFQSILLPGIFQKANVYTINSL